MLLGLLGVSYLLIIIRQCLLGRRALGIELHRAIQPVQALLDEAVTQKEDAQLSVQSRIVGSPGHLLRGNLPKTLQVQFQAMELLLLLLRLRFLAQTAETLNQAVTSRLIDGIAGDCLA